MKRLALSLLVLTGCPTPSVAPPAPPTIDDEQGRQMRAALVKLLRMPPEVAARLRRTDNRLHCGEYVDDVKKVGFVVAPVGDGFELDAMGSPPKPTPRCKTYDDFIQEQAPAK